MLAWLRSDNRRWCGRALYAYSSLSIDKNTALAHLFFQATTLCTALQLTGASACDTDKYFALYQCLRAYTDVEHGRIRMQRQ